MADMVVVGLIGYWKTVAQDDTVVVDILIGYWKTVEQDDTVVVDIPAFDCRETFVRYLLPHLGVVQPSPIVDVKNDCRMLLSKCLHAEQSFDFG